MLRAGMIIFMGAVVLSMAIALYAFTQYQTNHVTAAAGDPFMVGPVEYTVTFDGTHEGTKSVTPEETFVGIRITAENVGEERTRISGGQFYMVDAAGKRHSPVHGQFSTNDLLLHWLEPGEPIEKTTQFDIAYDGDATYSVIVRPQKDQSSVDVATICVTNC